MAARRCHPILGAGANFSPSLHQWFPAPLHHLSHPLLQDRPCQLTSPARCDLRYGKRRTFRMGFASSWWYSTRSPHDRGAPLFAFREPPPHRGPRRLNDRQRQTGSSITEPVVHSNASLGRGVVLLAPTSRQLGNGMVRTVGRSPFLPSTEPDECGGRRPTRRLLPFRFDSMAYSALGSSSLGTAARRDACTRGDGGNRGLRRASGGSDTCIGISVYAHSGISTLQRTQESGRVRLTPYWAST
jgi:hypothetical protein